MFNTHVSDSSQSATLTGAILLYGGDARTGQGGSFATVHRVETINQRPEIMPGRPMMEADLVTIASNSGRGQGGNHHDVAGPVHARAWC
jgi:hypothetical protein